MKTLHAQAEAVLKQVSIEEACSANNISIRNGNQILCPAHPVKMGKPNTNYGNCCIYHDRNTFTCHSCHTTGNVIELTMYAQNMSFCEATDWLAAQYAPWLLSGDLRKKVKPKTFFPFTEEEMRAIGLLPVVNCYLPIVNAPDKYSVYHNEGFESWADIQGIVTTTGSIIGQFLKTNVEDEFLICEQERASLAAFYEEDPVAFRLMVVQKASEVLKQINRQLHRMEEAAAANPEFGQAIKEEMEAKKDAARHVVNYYKWIDRTKRGKTKVS